MDVNTGNSSLLDQILGPFLGAIVMQVGQPSLGGTKVPSSVVSHHNSGMSASVSSSSPLPPTLPNGSRGQAGSGNIPVSGSLRNKIISYTK